MRRLSSVALAALACLVGIVDSASAQSRRATIAIPAGVSFNVVNPAVSTTGNPNPFRVTITNGSVRAGDRIYVSVKAETVNFSGPGTTRIPASKVSWTATAVSGGTASAGTLSSTAYSQVYRTRTNPGAGAVDMTWRLAAPAAAGLRAGTHSLTVRWRVEAF
ncbi:MAG: hypothetical protein ABL982_04455 [Vicinamibacterales bacterium]